jgi:hypothetical protein
VGTVCFSNFVYFPGAHFDPMLFSQMYSIILVFVDCDMFLVEGFSHGQSVSLK